MKKITSVFLAFLMLLSLGAVAFADTVAPAGGTSSQTVTASYEAAGASSVATVYYVTVEWNCSGNTIKYSEGTTTYAWDAENTKYTETAVNGKGWSGSASYSVTVTNQSNAAVTASVAWTPAAGITAEAIIGEALSLGSAAEGVVVAAGNEGVAQTGTIDVTVQTPTDGTISENGATIGSISLTISK